MPILASAAMVALKAAVGISMGSLAVLGSALDSLLDCGISTVNLLSARKAEQPPDEEHSFGHGKAEGLAVLFEGALIGGSGVLLAVQGVRHLLHPRSVESYWLGALVMLLSLLVSLWVSRYLVRRARETGSTILSADSLHYASDVWTSGAVLAALGLQALSGARWIDPVFSIAIALGILWQVRPILRGAVDELMDRELAPAERAEIERILHGQGSEILDYHRLRTRRSGPRKTVDVHVVLCKERPFEEAHAIVNRLEREIRAQIQNVDVLVHADPCSSAPVTCPGPHRERRAPARGPERPARVYYETVEELPREIRNALPADAQEDYVGAFNREYAESGSPERAADAAAQRLAPGYVREGKRWVRRERV